MWIAKYSLFHAGCWACESTSRFPQCSIVGTPVSSEVIERGKQLMMRHKVVCTVKCEKMKEFLKFTKKYPTIKSVNVLEEKIDTAILFVHIEDVDAVSNVIVNRAVVAKPTEVVNGKEHWTLIFADKKIMQETYNELKKISDIKLEGVSRIRSQKLLSEKQKRAIELARKHGYYEWPKKINLEELAKIAKVSRTTFEEHLRKAEKRLLTTVI